MQIAESNITVLSSESLTIFFFLHTNAGHSIFDVDKYSEFKKIVLMTPFKDNSWKNMWCIWWTSNKWAVRKWAKFRSVDMTVMGELRVGCPFDLDQILEQNLHQLTRNIAGRLNIRVWVP